MKRRLEFVPSFLRRRWARVAASLVFAALPTPGFALDPAHPIWHYNCRSWSRQNGLPVNAVNAIAQTPDGYLWLGATGGMLRFDGIEFKQIDLARLAELRSRTVKALKVGSDGGLWVGLEYSSFGYYDGRNFSFRGKEDWGGLSLNVREIQVGRDGSVWFAAEDEIARLNPAGQFEQILKWPGSIILNTQCVSEDPQGRIWFGTIDHGLYYWAENKLVKFPDPTLVSVTGIAVDHDGQIWVATERGFRCYDATFRRIPTVASEIEGSVLFVDREGAVWIGSKTSGLIRYWKGSYSYLHKSDGLGSENIIALFEDREGSMWIGTGGGLCQLADVKFPTVAPTENEPGEYAGAVAASSRGGIWIASRAGVSYFDGSYTTFSAAAGLPPGPVKRVFEASNGDVYFVSGYTTLSTLREGKVIAVHETPTLVVGIAEDQKGVIASVGGELFRVSKEALTPYVFVGEKPDFRWILNLLIGRSGELWVASENGIFSIKDGVAQKRAGADRLTDPRVQAVYEDDEGVIWASLFTGVARLKNNKVTCIGRKDGLLDNHIYGIVGDNFGQLWMDSSRGIFRVSRQSMNDFADGKITGVESTSYNDVDSVNTADKSARQEHVACKTLDGRIWFPSTHGVVVIDPRHIPSNSVGPPVKIDRVLANRHEIIPGKETVQPGVGELEFHFAALTFIAPQKTRFRYQLVGYDQEWVDAGDRRLAFYTNLKPGRYTFRVIAANADGAWNQIGDSVRVQLLPHIYQTTWFYTLCGGLVAAGMGGLYLGRMKVVERKQQSLRQARDLLETEVKKRTEELATVNGSLTEEVNDHKSTELQLKQRTQALEKEIEERKQMELEVARIHGQLVDTSRQAGMAEIATNVLHNVGNVLNSVNVSSGVVLEGVQKSSVGGIAKVAALLREHEGDLSNFFTNNTRAKQLPKYLTQLSERLAAEQKLALKELESLRENIEHIKEIVAMQQSYATVSGVREMVNLRDLVEDSLRINLGLLGSHGVELVRDFQEIPLINLDKHKVLQILVNLVRNAKYACDDSERKDKQVTVRVINEPGRVKVVVSDNGVGIPLENLTRIFAHGFTTRKGGHGFGLHSGSLAAKEMGGVLTAHSEGLGRGASFTLELPAPPSEPLSGLPRDRDFLAVVE